MLTTKSTGTQYIMSQRDVQYYNGEFTLQITSGFAKIWTYDGAFRWAANQVCSCPSLLLLSCDPGSNVFLFVSIRLARWKIKTVMARRLRSR